MLIFKAQKKTGMLKHALIAIFTLTSGMAVYAQDDLYMNSNGTGNSVEAISADTPEEASEEVSPTHDLRQEGQEGTETFSIYAMPWGGGLYFQQLHGGFNLSVGASVSAGFGGHSYSGVGFSQTIDATYALRLSNWLSLAAGGYFNNVYWTNDHYMNAGIEATADIRFDSHWGMFFYGQKTLYSSDQMPLMLKDMNDVGDRMGAGVTYNINPKVSVSMSTDFLHHNFRGNNFGASFSNGSFSLGGGLLPRLNFSK